MLMAKLNINGSMRDVEVEADTPLLWVIREQVGLTGTIEGLSTTGSHPIQKAWAAIDVPQCGYCQSGQIMAAAALLKRTPRPTDQDIDQAMTNICRCGTYQRIRAAVHLAANDTSRI